MKISKEKLKYDEEIISTLEKLKKLEDLFPKNEHNDIILGLIRLELIYRLEPESSLKYLKKQVK